MGSRPVLAPGSPDWVRVSPDGSLTLTPLAEAPIGTWRLLIQVRAAGQGMCEVVAEFDVQGAATAEADRHEVDPWCEVVLEPGVPGGVAVVTVDGGRPLPVGARGPPWPRTTTWFSSVRRRGSRAPRSVYNRMVLRVRDSGPALSTRRRRAPGGLPTPALARRAPAVPSRRGRRSRSDPPPGRTAPSRQSRADPFPRGH